MRGGEVENRPGAEARSNGHAVRHRFQNDPGRRVLPNGGSWLSNPQKHRPWPLAVSFWLIKVRTITVCSRDGAFLHLIEHLGVAGKVLVGKQINWWSHRQRFPSRGRRPTIEKLYTAATALAFKSRPRMHALMQNSAPDEHFV